MPERRDLVIEALTRPASHFHAWDAALWTAFVQQARGAGLLGRAAHRLRSLWPAGEAPPWPSGLDGHVGAAARLMQAQRAEVDRELAHIVRSLQGLGAPVIVLKGAAYHLAALPPAQSRLFSDIDLLVPRAAIGEAESRLLLAGWAGTHDNEYDQRYYREWMHELPPMQHLHRGTTLDLHHNILPSTARLKPRGELLVEAAVPVRTRPGGLFVLAPPDMVLHGMTHLFMNEEMSHALRDLSDLDLLLRHFGVDEDFWARLVERAARLDLLRPLHYGLHHTARVFGTPVPAGVGALVSRSAPARPLRPLMNALWGRALHSPHRLAAPRGSAAALFALYVRGHWLRMPALLLARHLTIKALRLHQPADARPVTVPTDG